MFCLEYNAIGIFEEKNSDNVFFTAGNATKVLFHVTVMSLDTIGNFMPVMPVMMLMLMMIVMMIIMMLAMDDVHHSQRCKMSQISRIYLKNLDLLRVKSYILQLWSFQAVKITDYTLKHTQAFLCWSHSSLLFCIHL